MVAVSAAKIAIATRVRNAGSTFYWAMRLMARRRREAMFAIYALARELDDIADGAKSASEKRAAIAAWRDEIAAIYAGRPTSALGQALGAAVADFRLPRSEFELLINGMSEDIDGPIRAPAMAALEAYCRRVAGSIGLLSLPVFGCDDENARAFALCLGQAMQLTNILRDLAEDAAAGRLYLPSELLAVAGVETREPISALEDPRIAIACDALAERAESRFREAGRLLARCRRRALWPALVMMASYRRILAKLRAKGGWPVAIRPKLGTGERLWLVTRVALGAEP